MKRKTHYYNEKDQCKIEIDNFLSTWWVKNVLTDNDDQRQKLRQIKSEDDCSQCNAAALPVNVLLFLKWLIAEVSSKNHSKRKVSFVFYINAKCFFSVDET